ncbi:hypothetical protein [Pannonibacter tanglangensis]|uniref:Uncharacterized protein n=1 Tax=Pannonibacter tanglangensis TaxID=2750084 RepID=A0ABW9ZI37_9HYPH|nr:hypothetical protein [Pannonibacter sp. XCT-34]NBN62789.1 hypothetical protein [Pannonibacter sp. XCT-34]
MTRKKTQPAASTRVVAFPDGGIIPASESHTGHDYSVEAHTPVELRREYAEHLIHDRFAYAVDAPEADGKEADPTPAAENTPPSELDPDLLRAP